LSPTAGLMWSQRPSPIGIGLSSGSEPYKGANSRPARFAVLHKSGQKGRLQARRPIGVTANPAKKPEPLITGRSRTSIGVDGLQAQRIKRHHAARPGLAQVRRAVPERSSFNAIEPTPSTAFELKQGLPSRERLISRPGPQHEQVRQTLFFTLVKKASVRTETSMCRGSVRTDCSGDPLQPTDADLPCAPSSPRTPRVPGTPCLCGAQAGSGSARSCHSRNVGPAWFMV
jgi:hypothetical protein